MTENLRVPENSAIVIGDEGGIRALAMNRILPLYRLRFQTQVKMQSELCEVWCQIERSRNRDKEQVKDNELPDLAVAAPGILKGKLKDKNPLVQLAAIRAVHNRRVHLEKELIACLSERQPVIREAARQALVRLSRGGDCGPRPNAGTLERRQAVRRWETWLALQKGPASSAELAPLDPAEAEATRWATELVQAGKDKENDICQRVREAPEPQGTLALALAIQDLKGPRQTKVRQTLADRLAGQDADLVKQRFSDEDAEVRRAALAAAAKQKARPLIPDALKLLEDPDPGVAQSARSALKILTNQDFGPAANASPLDRSIAIGRWYQWWVKQQK